MSDKEPYLTSDLGDSFSLRRTVFYYISLWSSSTGVFLIFSFFIREILFPNLSTDPTLNCRGWLTEILHFKSGGIIWKCRRWKKRDPCWSDLSLIIRPVTEIACRVTTARFLRSWISTASIWRLTKYFNKIIDRGLFYFFVWHFGIKSC